MRLSDKVAIITGGISGIGRATVKQFVDEGASLVIADIDRPGLDKMVSELSAAGHKVQGVYCDVTRNDDVKAMVDATIAAFGRIDVLVNCAGGSGMTPYYQTEEGRKQKWMEEIPLAEWDATIALNLTGPFICCQHVVPHMKRQGGGKIVNFSSVGADLGMPDSSSAYAAYAAAKAGVTGLTRQLAVELGPFHINVNCVCPGTILSERIKQRILSYSEAAAPGEVSAWTGGLEKRTANTPLRRLGNPEDIAVVVAFLASEEASFMTGTTVDINGGRFMR